MKRGLICSITAHACFNGSLTVAAIILALAPGHVVHGPGYDITVARGWHAADTSGAPMGGLYVQGPSGADVAIFQQDVGSNTVAIDRLLTMMKSSEANSFMPGMTIDSGSTQEISLPIGEAVEASIEIHGHHGELVFVPENSDVLIIAFGSGGSVAAVQDFHKMLPTLHRV